MDKLVPSLVLLISFGFVLSQYDDGRGGFHGHVQSTHPPANILLHKQALGQDGSFNYAFAADNGLQQGEVINPDGSRKGSYSYVDPNGKTVSLSYTAGKDGFRVLNGDHVPKVPEQQQQLQQQRQPHQNFYPQQPLIRPNPHYQPQEVPHYPGPVPYEAYRNSPNAPSYRGNPVQYEEAYRQPPQHHVRPGPPSLPPHAVPQYRVNPAQYEAAYRHAAPQPRPVPHYQPRQYSVEERNYDKPAPYLAQQFQGSHGPEGPQKPHSFGDGFSFEFAG